MTGPSPDFYLKIYSCTHRVGCVSSCWMRLGVSASFRISSHTARKCPQGVTPRFFGSALHFSSQMGILLLYT